MNHAVQELVQKSFELQKQGEREGALLALSQAFDLLIDASADYAKEQEIEAVSAGALRSVEVKLIEHSTHFLKKDLSAAMILNTMGVLFSELEQYDAALQKFEESIATIPDGEEYDEVFRNRDAAILKLQELYKEEQGGEDDFLE